MQNLQFSLLSFLGGKPAGDAITGAGAGAGAGVFAPDHDSETGTEGFFSFIEGLLTAPKNDDDANAAATPAAQGAVPLPAFNADAIRRALAEIAPERLQDDGDASTLGAPVQELIAPATGKPDVVNLRQHAPGPANAPVAADQANTLLNIDGAKSAAVDASAPFGPTMKSAATAFDPALADGEADNTMATNAAPEAAIDGEAADVRFDTRPAHDRPRGLNDNLKSHAMTALSERAAPEAFSNSAVTRQDAIDPAFVDRTVHARADVPAHSAPPEQTAAAVRDQLVAAVTHRPGDHKLEIRLDPPELGKVMISFESDGGDVVRAVISADTPDTLDLMRRHADVLQRSLEAQGFANLDLHFADHGPREQANARAEEHARNFILSEGDDVAHAEGHGAHVAQGRLDRRL